MINPRKTGVCEWFERVVFNLEAFYGHIYVAMTIYVLLRERPVMKVNSEILLNFIHVYRYIQQQTVRTAQHSASRM